MPDASGSRTSSGVSSPKALPPDAPVKPSPDEGGRGGVTGIAPDGNGTRSGNRGCQSKRLDSGDRPHSDNHSCSRSRWCSPLRRSRPRSTRARRHSHPDSHTTCCTGCRRCCSGTARTASRRCNSRTCPERRTRRGRRFDPPGIGSCCSSSCRSSRGSSTAHTESIENGRATRIDMTPAADDTSRTPAPDLRAAPSRTPNSRSRRTRRPRRSPS